jgi:dTDP-4-dehydrorhamnose 3,5-epimerase
MTVTETGFPDLKILEPIKHEDARGFFMESYNKEALRKYNIHIDFVQDNLAHSCFGVIRGLHFQKNPFAQTKLIFVLEGHIRDIVVDLRVGSPTFGKSYAIDLTAENKKQFLVPQGFAHGYSVLSEKATVMYKCDATYHKESEGGMMPLDPALQLDWGIPEQQRILSEKDLAAPFFNDLPPIFTF